MLHTHLQHTDLCEHRMLASEMWYHYMVQIQNDGNISLLGASHLATFDDLLIPLCMYVVHSVHFLI